MHEKLLSRITRELLHPRHGASRSSRGRSTPAGFGLDRALVSDFVAGTPTPQREAELADQVARLLPFHWVLPNTLAAGMSEIIDHLGGQHGLVTWLDRHPGLPRLVARLYVVMGLLDRYSEEPAVVTALRESRERTPYPPGLKGCLLPETDDETLAGIAFEIEELLGDGHGEQAAELAEAAATWLQQAAPRAEELNPEVGELGELMNHMRHDIRTAADSWTSQRSV
ncbi:hypothetical protein GCM10010377_60930 [Streptomyces viridiviolaceus]|uniref:Uncharacterized protein n=1 Tax=Streptomyces viridiviolaceus TaxID=68282 RepID=A0ABW2EG07_9ACTN|nr:hypothetical protein [Streptomyces viridiviolaceus]GHB61753.1 hypothetical protein GCM10010377_60930 [Streptomyces viridiviolaceus]